MAEVQTQPLAATFVDHADFYDADMNAKVPGSLCESGEEGRWLYACPCGCGASGALRVGNGVKPAQSPSWQWNGSKAAPTLLPSVHYVGHWHGWLTDGVWMSC